MWDCGLGGDQPFAPGQGITSHRPVLQRFSVRSDTLRTGSSGHVFAEGFPELKPTTNPVVVVTRCVWVDEPPQQSRKLQHLQFGLLGRLLDLPHLPSSRKGLLQVSYGGPDLSGHDHRTRTQPAKENITWINQSKQFLVHVSEAPLISLLAEIEMVQSSSDTSTSQRIRNVFSGSCAMTDVFNTGGAIVSSTSLALGLTLLDFLSSMGDDFADVKLGEGRAGNASNLGSEAHRPCHSCIYRKVPA